MNIARPIQRHARLTPDRAALIEPITDRVRTFGQLDERTDALASSLVEDLGLEPGARVTVIAKNCIEYLEIYLACAKAGCITHGMNWRFARPAMLDALRDTGPELVILHQEFATVAAELQREYDGAQWLYFGQGSDGSYEKMVAAAAQRPRLGLRADGDDPLMIIYTGGTTGDSKGALHSHATATAAMANNTIAERIVPTDRYMLIGQAFHSAVVLALNYLRHGCAVVVLNFDPQLALEAIDECRVTSFLGFPTMLTYMLEKGTSGSYRLDSLRNIQYGGGMFAEATIFALLDTFPCTLIQCYGTSESIGITFLSQEDHQLARRERPGLLRSCGTPAFLTDVKLAPGHDHADVEGHRVGEIMVRSPSTMLRYWGQRERSPEWLPTGDLAYSDDDGYLYLVGRLKDVIISGGENIYASQVENAIHKHPAVLETAVIGVPDEIWGEAVKAVVVLRAGQQATASEIQDWVRTELAGYQRPKIVEFAAELPRTPTGKILKRALR